MKGKSKNYGYPTQKPLALLERIIRASSNEGDIILDPFCGCATACVAAEKLGRQWVGADISFLAYQLVQLRIKREIYESDSGMFAPDDRTPKAIGGKMPEVNCKTDPPKRTDGGLPVAEQKYVYVISNPRYKNDYKVGIASDPRKRLGAYQTGSVERDYKIEYQKLTPHYSEIEKYIHEKYPNNHEWVTGGVKDIIRDIETYTPG